jgi:hypothetical protein
MAATYTVTQIERKHQLGDVRAIAATVTSSGASTYTTGGDSLDLATLLGLNRIDMVIFDGPAIVPAGGAADPVFDYTNKKLKLYGGAAAGALQAELTAATNIFTMPVKCLVIGA